MHSTVVLTVDVHAHVGPVDHAGLVGIGDLLRQGAAYNPTHDCSSHITLNIAWKALTKCRGRANMHAGVPPCAPCGLCAQDTAQRAAGKGILGCSTALSHLSLLHRPQHPGKHMSAVICGQSGKRRPGNAAGAYQPYGSCRHAGCCGIAASHASKRLGRQAHSMPKKSSTRPAAAAAAREWRQRRQQCPPPRSALGSSA